MPAGETRRSQCARSQSGLPESSFCTETPANRFVTERTSSSGVSPAGTKSQLLSLAEDPLGAEDHECHQDGTDDHEAQRGYARV